MGRIFYVSSMHGDDTNSGQTPEDAFRSLRKINQLEIQPGDQIFLERGSVFIGEYLHLYAGGTKEAPVVVDAYGEGALPRIEADGNGIWYQNYGGHLDNVVHTWKGYLSSAVLLYDAEYISIRNLEITNNPCIKNERLNQADRMNRTGVSVIAQNHGTLHQIELDHLYIHGVEGNIYDKHLNNGGIYMSVSRPDDEEKTGIARYDGIHIHHCKVENCRRWGIAAGYTYQHDKFTTLELPDEVVKTYGSTNVVIEHNFVKDIGGDGITPMYCFEPLIQYNISENIAVDIHPDLYNEEGNRGGMTAAAIVLPMMPDLGLSSLAAVLAIGSGTMMGNHYNNSGFWVMGQFYHLNTKQAVKYVTVPCAVASVICLIAVVILNAVGVFG